MKLSPHLSGRVARPAGARRNLAKTGLQIVVMWTIFFFLLPALISRVEARSRLAQARFGSRPGRRAGSLLFLAAAIPAVASGMIMAVVGQGTPLPADCPRRLVVAGPYRYVRNPMALTGLVQGLAVALYLGSPMVVVYALVGALGWNYTVRPWEEQDLERRFGAPYVAYRVRVRCWIPHLRPYNLPPGSPDSPAAHAIRG